MMLDPGEVFADTREGMDAVTDVALVGAPTIAERSISTESGGQLRSVLVAIDLVSVVAAWSIAVTLGEVSNYGRSSTVFHDALTVAGITAVVMTLLGTHKLYRARVCAVRSIELAKLIRVGLFSGVSSVLVARLFHLTLPWGWATLGAGGMFALDAGGRGLFSRWLRTRRSSGRFSRSVVLIGDNDEALELYRITQSHPESGVRVVGIVGRSGSTPRGEFDLPWLGTVDDLPNAVDHVNGAMIAVSSFSAAELNRTVRVLLNAEVHVQMSSGLAGISYRRLRPLPLAREPMFYVEQLRPSRAQLLAKRALDLVLASIVMVVAAPVLLAAIIAIKLEDRKAPLFYRQERIGRNGQPFMLYKLRTMVPDAAQRLAELQALNQRNGPLFKLAQDPRVTRVGRLLRQTSIDELPQLVNVLRGSMSMVGPRPALASEVAEFDAALQARQDVTPGLTGLWQVEARDNPSFHAYRRLDLFYLENWSLLLDLAIIASTVMVVLGRAGRVFGPRRRSGATVATLD